MHITDHTARNSRNLLYGRCFELKEGANQMDNKQVTAEWIAQQRAVCEAATPGPWVAENTKLNRAVIGGTIELLNWVGDKPFYTKNDFKFITAARTALPAALDALEASIAEIERLKEHVRMGGQLSIKLRKAGEQREAEKDKEIEWLKQQLENQAKR